MTIGGVRCLNMATHNYLGFAGNETIEAAAVECIRKFGVGSCGPRAFYGTAGQFHECGFSIIYTRDHL